MTYAGMLMSHSSKDGKMPIGVPKQQQQQQQQKRQHSCMLTGHVATRPYRAPEVILNELYGTQMDLWSAGACLGELIRFLPSCVGVVREPMCLFPGGTCLPMSGASNCVRDRKAVDQLDLIVHTCGGFDAAHVDTMSAYAKERISTLPSSHKREGFESLTQRVDKTRIDESSSACCTLAHALDLLNRLLVLDPARRLTATQALQHPLFTSFHDPRLEVCFDPVSIMHTFNCDCFICIEARSFTLEQQVKLLSSASSSSSSLPSKVTL
jgi:serine/threonine protein kinase